MSSYSTPVKPSTWVTDLRAFCPPLFNNPSTLGFFDNRTRTLFSSDCSDCSGAPMPSAEFAGCDDVREVPADELRGAQLLWAAVDSPWVHTTATERFRDTLEPVRAMDPDLILSSHLPPAIGRSTEFLDTLLMAPDTEPFVGPDQQALEQILAGFEPATP